MITVDCMSTSSSGSFSTSSTSYTAVTNLTASITTNGRPVYVSLVPAESALASFDQSVSTGSITLKLERSSGPLNLGEQTFILASGESSGVTPSWLWVPAAGAHSISVYIKVSAGTIGVTNYKLFCYEL